MAITSAELITKKKAQLAALESSIALAEKQQTYSLDDGQGKQNVARGSLESMYRQQASLETEILQLENGSSRSFHARLG